MSRLSPERLAELRARTADWVCMMDDPIDLLAHIDALEAENKRLREALETIAATPCGLPHHAVAVGCSSRRVAQAALEATGEGGQ